MQTKEYTVFSFDELNEEAKQKAIDSLRDINIDYYWAEVTIWNAKDKLEALGYKDIEVFYSGFYSQGDGACFEAKVDISTWLKAHKMGNKFRVLYNNAQDLCSIEIKHSGHYYHENSMVVDGTLYDHSNEQLGRQFDSVVEMIEKEIVELAKEIYKELENEYECRMTDEAVIDTINANEYEFLENGTQSAI